MAESEGLEPSKRRKTTSYLFSKQAPHPAGYFPFYSAISQTLPTHRENVNYKSFWRWGQDLNLRDAFLGRPLAFQASAIDQTLPPHRKTTKSLIVSCSLEIRERIELSLAFRHSGLQSPAYRAPLRLGSPDQSIGITSSSVILFSFINFSLAALLRSIIFLFISFQASCSSFDIESQIS